MATFYRICSILFAALLALAPAAVQAQGGPPPFDIYQNVKPYATFLPADGTVQGNLVGANNNLFNYLINNSCNNFYTRNLDLPDRVFSFTLTRPLQQVFIRKRIASHHNLLLIDSSGRTDKVALSSENLNDPSSANLPMGTTYLSVELEQGSSTTASDAFDIEMKSVCVPTYTEANYGWNIWFNNGLTTSGATQYSTLYSCPNLTGKGVLTIGATNKLTLQATEGIGMVRGAPFYRLFVDFNEDGDFSDDGELIYRNTSPAPYNLGYYNLDGTISLALEKYGTTMGKTLLMRIIAEPSLSNADPCGNLGSATVSTFWVKINDQYQNVKPFAVPLPSNGIAQGNLIGASNNVNGYSFQQGCVTTIYTIYNQPDKVFKISLPRPSQQVLVRKRVLSAHKVILLDTSGSSAKVVSIDGDINYIGNTKLPMGSAYLVVEQGSATTSDAFDVEVKSVCLPSFTEANYGTNLTLNGASVYYEPPIPYNNCSYVGGSAVLNIGTNNTVNVQKSYYSYSQPPYYRLFIDFNEDGDFSDVGELIYSEKTPSVYHDDNFILPSSNPLYAGAAGKTLVMRMIAEGAISTADPCGNLGTATVSTFYVKVNSPAPPINPNVDFRFARIATNHKDVQFKRVKTGVDGSLTLAGGAQIIYSTNPANFYVPYSSYTVLNGIPGQSGGLNFEGGKNSNFSTLGVLTRYSREGAYRWGCTLWGEGSPVTSLNAFLDIKAIAVDRYGSTLACGNFAGTVYVKDATGATTQMTPSPGGGYSGGWIAQFNAAGKLLFIFQFGNISSVDISGVDVTSDGKFYVAGSFRGTSTFQGKFGSAVTLVGRGNYDAFIAKFTGVGSMYWMLQGGGPGNDFGYGAAADINGGGYLLGSFENTATFTSSLFGTVPITKTSVGGSDGFVLSIANAGALQWVATMGGPTNENVKDVAPDPRGTGLVAVGSFSNTAQFGATSLSSIGFYDVFATRLNTAGGFVWATKAGGYGQDYGNAVRLDKNGNALVGMSFQQTISAPFGAGPIVSAGNTDGAIFKLDATTGLAQAGFPRGLVAGPNNEAVMGIDTVDGGGAVAVGYAQNNVVFGQLGTFRNGGYTDGFLTRYSGAATGIAREAENNDLATAAPAGRMVLYPNPATGLVHIKIAQLADKDYPLTIVDMQGKEVFADTYTAEQLAAGVSISLKPIAGLYMVRCANTTAKLVVE